MILFEPMAGTPVRFPWWRSTGDHLLSPTTIDRIFEVQSNSIDLVLGIPLRMGIGYGLLPMPNILPSLPEGRLCSWGGAGGKPIIGETDGQPVGRFSGAEPLRSTTGQIEAMCLYAGRSVSGVTRVQRAAEVIEELVRDASPNRTKQL